MSGLEVPAADGSSMQQQPRQNRLRSLDIISGSSFFGDEPKTDSIDIPPPIPRRNSATITNVDMKPPIPKRYKNEKPVPVLYKPLTQLGSDIDQSSKRYQCRRNAMVTELLFKDEEQQQPFLNPANNKTTVAAAAATFDEESFNRASQEFEKKLHDEIEKAQFLNRPPRRGERSPRSPISRQPLHIRSSEEDGDDEEEFSLIRNNASCTSRHNSKYMEMQAASRRLENRLPELERRFQENKADDVAMTGNARTKSQKMQKATQTNLPPPLSSISSACNISPDVKTPVSTRQDSNISSDSFSQTSSPSYTSKTMEAPLLPYKHINGKIPGRAMLTEYDNPPGSPITKSISTPAGLQTIVKFQSGSNMSFHQRIIKDIRRPSSHYVPRARLRVSFLQVLINVAVLILIAGAIAGYFGNKSESSSLSAVDLEKNITSLSTKTSLNDMNPAPGICLPVIVDFCLRHKVPYNYTVFPNYMGNFDQREAQHELENYNSLVDVRCYELTALFLCSVFVPKCGLKGEGRAVTPCMNLCYETKRRCGFFLDIFGLKLPYYMDCKMLSDSPDPNACVGHSEVIEVARKAAMPVCSSGFQCDQKRCIPLDWHCDGHVDCEDRSDETDCDECTKMLPKTLENAKKNSSKSFLYCGNLRCMSPSHICDGVMDCPWGQDERNCIRLSKRNGDIGMGRLEVYHAKKAKFMPACISELTNSTSEDICRLLGYSIVESSKFIVSNVTDHIDFKSDYQEESKNLLQEFQQCTKKNNFSNVELTCAGYECGRRNTYEDLKTRKKRIIGGVESSPGDWPFLAALLGGPEQIFYCAGVLIADQWVLTASHCVGNYTDILGYTIQLGITRRQSHTYLGQKLKVKKVVTHPNYDLGVEHDNDIALFQLERRVEFHEHLRPVCLPQPNVDYMPKKKCTVIGWGKREDAQTSEYEPAVNEVKVPVLKREVCNSWLLHQNLNVTDGMICAGYSEGGKDACQGDSGGPLLCQDEEDENRWFVLGIVSWGIKCAHPKLPGVYAYVPKFVPWIMEEISKTSLRTDKSSYG